jgi:hypothetical protein
MMDQLGIKVLRPAFNSNQNAPNPANYDESKANPYPEIPDPLAMNDGKKVASADMWWKARRPQLVDLLSKYVYGFVPPNVPKVTWTVSAVDHERIGLTPVIAKDLIGEVDNSSCPAITVKIHMTIVTPANAQGPVPMLMEFTRARFPDPNAPRGEDLEKINAAMRALLIQQDPWRSISVLPWSSSAHPVRAELRFCAASSARASPTCPPTSITGWPAVS